MTRAFPFGLLVALLAATSVLAQAPPASVAETRDALAAARADGTAAAARATRLEAAANAAGAAADRTAEEAAAVAARIQQAEADIAADEAQIGLIAHQREILRTGLARRQRPLVRLTGALQLLSRRPLAVALLRPGSVEDAVHLRALLETMLPEVARRTAALRAEIARGRALQAQAHAAEAALRAEEATLAARRQTLVALETRQRLAARDVSGSADRESERALALAEQARDLGVLVAELGKDGALADALARLPGPVLRPPQPALAQAAAPVETAPSAAPDLPAYMLPVTGRVVTGFGEMVPGSGPSEGVSLAPRGGAQVVAPAAGRVAFAGPYRGFGEIVIIDHAGGWTSLVTGLARTDARVGDALVAGSPLGVAGPGRPVLTLELRQSGVPVNPLEHLRG